MYQPLLNPECIKQTSHLHSHILKCIGGQLTAQVPENTKIIIWSDRGK
jgi:hypothetical protein